MLFFFFGVVRINHVFEKRRKKEKKLPLKLPENFKQQFTNKDLNSMYKTFKVFDKDDGGYIWPDELKRVLIEFGHSASDQEIRVMLNDAFTQQVDVVDVHNHFGTTADGKVLPVVPACTCGNVFAEASLFCRRCGTRRPPAVTEVDSITFIEFCNVVHIDRQKGTDSQFTSLVAEVEAKVTFVHGQNFAYLALLLTFLVIVPSSTVSSCSEK
jgi:hypothetical protein